MPAARTDVRLVFLAIAVALAGVMIFTAARSAPSPGASPARAAVAAHGPVVLAAQDLIVASAAMAPSGVHAGEARVVQLGRPDPRGLAPATPRRAAAEWLSAWYQRAWGRMRVWSTPVPAAPVPSSWLRARFGPGRLEGWALGRRARAAADHAVVDVRVAVRPLLRMTVQRRSLTLTLRRAGGVWKVDTSAVVAPIAAPMA
ncbi:hypothetical protein FSW04_12360 [Baekduia soli]|uniref:Uncharacterized protein n=1 Tax=Baekduia soli TaxID=496014 RepID=A0A5B8U6J5_9ACTN|nr:hypothetical protein [Baekduia soli]QEC48282.1 hypothetical protein FSW04_12360 [Baekduia soli]